MLLALAFCYLNGRKGKHKNGICCSPATHDDGIFHLDDGNVEGKQAKRDQQEEVGSVDCVLLYWQQHQQHQQQQQQSSLIGAFPGVPAE